MRRGRRLWAGLKNKETSEWKRKLVRVFVIGLCAVDARGCDAPRVTTDEVDVVWNKRRMTLALPQARNLGCQNVLADALAAERRSENRGDVSPLGGADPDSPRCRTIHGEMWGSNASSGTTRQ